MKQRDMRLNEGNRYHGAGFIWPMLRAPLLAVWVIAAVLVTLFVELRVPAEQRLQNLQSSQAYP